MYLNITEVEIEVHVTGYHIIVSSVTTFCDAYILLYSYVCSITLGRRLWLYFSGISGKKFAAIGKGRETNTSNGSTYLPFQ